MNAMMALFDSEIEDEIFTLLELVKIKNYTQFRGLSGSSTHGKKEGSVAWPGANEIVLLIVNEEQRDSLKTEVQKYKKERQPAPGLLLFDWPLEGVL